MFANNVKRKRTLLKHAKTFFKIFILFALLISFTSPVAASLLPGDGNIKLMGCSCSSDSAYGAFVTIQVHPRGGFNVQDLTCTFKTSVLTYGADIHPDVALTVEWMSSSGTQKKEILETNLQEQTFATTFSAPHGQYLNGSFWVKISWSDKNGKQAVESKKAACMVSSLN